VTKITRHTDVCQLKKHSRIIFGVHCLRNDNAITSKPTWKHTNYSRVFGIFSPICHQNRSL